jgi:hypothetical protein
MAGHKEQDESVISIYIILTGDIWSDDTGFRGGEVAETAYTAPSTCGASSRKDARSRCRAPCHHSSSSGGPLITFRNSIGMFNGTAPGPGAADARAATA